MRSIDRVFFLVESYCLASGSKLNKEKTWGIWLGGWRNCADTPCNINWTNSYRKLCGVILGNGNFININWKDRRQKMSTAINIHSSRALSIRGKSILVDSVLASKLWCIGSILILPAITAR